MNRLVLITVCLLQVLCMWAETLTVRVNCRYLNIPISHKVERKRLVLTAKGEDTLSVVVRIAEGVPDYWVFKDVSRYKGKRLELSYEGSMRALENIVQADSIFGASAMYREENRPQFHFTARRGWINDPNGLVYHNGLYHLYYQHNPFEREWENMTWGHATSTDLLHWTEHDDVLFPDHLGTMYSGSAVFDEQNTSGFGTEKCPPLVYAYTADRSEREVQCIAYSLDGGMTLKKYEGNPVIDSHDMWQTHDTRDPRLFWYAPGKHWVLVLNERDGHSIYNSFNLKDWTFQSHVTGFWECPDLFELPVDGNPDNTRWVMYGASNTYMIGTFDGKTFVPEGGKYRFCTGSIYAAQTVSHTPDGRRIQIGWGRVSHPGMPFNGMMLLPTELTLRSTRDGIRMISKPVSEVQSLLQNVFTCSDAVGSDVANRMLEPLNQKDGLHLTFTLHLNHRTSAGLSFAGRNILDYDSNFNTINGQFYSPQEPTSMDLTADIYIDRTSIEVFIDEGLYSYSMEWHERKPEGLRFWGTNLTISGLKVDRVKSIW
ncbi:MAG: glycoside hydrolase family 32 protein [Bacteroidaceae bacterium]|nr:glycoside hydrolase family 32 protein [Bacteroidaceae bacterium]